jgi:hypothetical protein
MHAITSDLLQHAACPGTASAVEHMPNAQAAHREAIELHLLHEVGGGHSVADAIALHIAVLHSALAEFWYVAAALNPCHILQYPTEHIRLHGGTASHSGRPHHETDDDAIVIKQRGDLSDAPQDELHRPCVVHMSTGTAQTPGMNVWTRPLVVRWDPTPAHAADLEVVDALAALLKHHGPRVICGAPAALF